MKLDVQLGYNSIQVSRKLSPFGVVRSWSNAAHTAIRTIAPNRKVRLLLLMEENRLVSGSEASPVVDIAALA